MTLYISDLDGTLLSSSGKLDLRAADMLNDFISGGALISYCTARRIQSAGPIMKELHLNIPVILMNGVFIYDTVKDEYIQKNVFDRKQSELLRDTVIRLKEQPMVYSFSDGKLRNNFFKDAPDLKNYLKERKNDDTLHPVKSYEEMFAGEAFYAVFINPKNKTALDKVFTAENGFSHVYYSDVYHEYEYWYEVFSSSASKANAVLQLKELVSADEVVCFGDNGNDLSMFKAADRCYAVSNAIDEVKEAATAIIGSNDMYAVPEFIQGELFPKFDFEPIPDGIDEARFASAREKALRGEKRGIGTLNEKAIHNTLKRYYCDDIDHEAKIGGFFADAAGEHGIFEIQTGSFSKLNKKLSQMLRVSHVTVVYPYEKLTHTYSINESTGEVLSSSKRTNNSYSKLFLELYRIKAFLTNPNLTVIIAELEVEKKIYFKDERKTRRRGLRKEKTPLRLIKETRLENKAGYKVFLPSGLPDEFVRADYERLCPVTDSSLALKILEFTGCIVRTGKRGNAVVYRITEKL